MHAPWRLFLDDDAHGSRMPSKTVEDRGWRDLMSLAKRVPDVSHLGGWVIACSYDEAVSAVESRGMPTFVSFDHDLGMGRTGKDFANYLVNKDLDGDALPENFSFEVHSANPIGRRNIRQLLEGYLASSSGISPSMK